jgi:hypothetical protein
MFKDKARRCNGVEVLARTHGQVWTSAAGGLLKLACPLWCFEATVLTGTGRHGAGCMLVSMR